MMKNFYTQFDKTWIADAPSDCYNITITVTFNKKEKKYGVYSQSSKTTESSNHDS